MDSPHTHRSTHRQEHVVRNVLIALVVILASIGLGRYALHGEGYPMQPLPNDTGMPLLP